MKISYKSLDTKGGKRTSRNDKISNFAQNLILVGQSSTPFSQLCRHHYYTMDTILKPRHLAQTESEHSSDDGGNSVQTPKHNFNSSTWHSNSESDHETFLDNIGKVKHDENEEFRDHRNHSPVVIYPTARFLQVNPKTKSSFELLVAPAKRRRLHSPLPPSREAYENNSNEKHFLKAAPLSESFHYENETPSTSIQSQTESLPGSVKVHFVRQKGPLPKISETSEVASETSANSRQPYPYPSSNGTNSQANAPPAKVVNLTDESILGFFQGMMTQSTDNDTMEPREDGTSQYCPEFPSTPAYTFYVNHIRNMSQPLDSIVYETEDENRNITYVKSQNQNNSRRSRTSKSVGQLLPGPFSKRIYKKAFYRLRNYLSLDKLSMSNSNASTKPPPVSLRESDYDSELELTLIEKDELARNPPLDKRRKLNAPGEFIDEENDQVFFAFGAEVISNLPPEVVPQEESSCTTNTKEEFYTILKIRNELKNESEILSSVTETSGWSSNSFPIEEQQIFPEIFQFQIGGTNGEVRTTDSSETPQSLEILDIRDVTEEPVSESAIFQGGYYTVDEGNTFPFQFPEYVNHFGYSPDPTLQQPHTFTWISNDKLSSSPNTPQSGGCIVESPPDTGSVDFQQPYTIIIGDSSFTPQMESTASGFLFGSAMPFINLSPGGTTLAINSDSESDSRIEEIFDDDENDDVPINCSSVLVETILSPSGDPVLERKNSGSCSVVDGLILECGGDEDYIPPQLNDYEHAENLDNQEVLMQPKPQLKFSSSFSTLSLGKETTGETFEGIERETRSDFISGRLQRISKSFVQLCQKYLNRNKSTEGKNEEADAEICVGREIHDDDGVKTSGERLQIAGSVASIKSVLSACFRRLASGNRVGDTCQTCPLQNNVNEIIPAGKRSESKDFQGETLSQSDVNMNMITFNANEIVEKDDLPEKRGDMESNKATTSSMGEISEDIGLLNKITVKTPIQDPGVPELGKESIQEQQLGFGKYSKIEKQQPPKATIFRRILHLFTRGFGRHPNTPDETKNLELAENPTDVSRINVVPVKEDSSGRKDETKVVEVSLIQNDRTIARHTDSRELYREKRLKFFKERNEFRDDSIKAYVKTMLEVKDAEPTKEFTIPMTDAPLSFAMRNCRGKLGEVLVTGRLAMSESTLPSKRMGRGVVHGQNIMLPVSPVLPLPAAAATASLNENQRTENGEEDDGDGARHCIDDDDYENVTSNNSNKVIKIDKDSFTREKVQLKGILKNKGS